MLFFISTEVYFLVGQYQGLEFELICILNLITSRVTRVRELEIVFRSFQKANKHNLKTMWCSKQALKAIKALK
jgi:hypothetical protein